MRGDLDDLRRTLGHCRLLSADKEAQLSRLATEGDLRAMARLVESQIRWALCIVGKWHRRRGRGLDIEDAAAEAISHLPAICIAHDPDRGRLTTLVTISVRRRLELWRHRNRRRAASLDDEWRLPADPYDPVEEVQRREDAERVHRAVRKLPGLHRQTALEFLERDESAFDAARRHGLTSAAIDYRRRTAFERLRRTLQGAA